MNIHKEKGYIVVCLKWRENGQYYICRLIQTSRLVQIIHFHFSNTLMKVKTETSKQHQRVKALLERIILYYARC